MKNVGHHHHLPSMASFSKSVVKDAGNSTYTAILFEKAFKR